MFRSWEEKVNKEMCQEISSFQVAIGKNAEWPDTEVRWFREQDRHIKTGKNVHQYLQYSETASTSAISWLKWLKFGCLSTKFYSCLSMKSMKARVGAHALNTDEALGGTFPNPELLFCILLNLFSNWHWNSFFFVRQNMISEDAIVSLDMLKAIEWEGLWGCRHNATNISKCILYSSKFSSCLYSVFDSFSIMT